MASGTIKNTTAEIANQTPETIYRPISENQYSSWTYTVPYSGILYLCFAGMNRKWSTIKIDNIPIASIAVTPSTAGAPNGMTIPIFVTKGQTVFVDGLEDQWYLLASVTCLIAFPLQP